MPSEYVQPPIESDPEELAQLQIDTIKEQEPDWEPNDANLDTWIIRANAEQAAELRDLVVDVPASIFRYFGSEILGIPPEEAAAASALSTWTMYDDAGYTIEAGTQVGLRGPDNELIAFIVQEDILIPSGSTATAPGEVVLEAAVEGADANGLTTPVELIDALPFVDVITLTGPPAGGMDDEDDLAYLDRLSRYMRLFRLAAVDARDFADIAREEVAGVWRATAIDNYNPADGTTDNEKMVYVVVQAVDGGPVSADVKAAADDFLQALREVNFIVNVGDPTYNTIDVTYTAYAEEGQDPAAVEDQLDEAIANFLDPSAWGSPRGGDPGESPLWRNTTTVRYGELMTALNNSGGVAWIESLTLRKPPAAFAAADVTMAGPVPLPQLGTVTGTVNNIV